MWGTGPYGVTPWGGLRGGGGPTGFYIIDAFAVTSQSCVVVLSQAPTESSPIGVGDALNRDTWTLVSVDSGLSLEILDAEIYPFASNAIQLFTMQPFLGKEAVYRVQSTTLQKDFQAGLIQSPNSWDFFGAPVAPMIGPGAIGLVDLHNPPTPNSPVAGALSNDSTGDYVLESGEKFYRKLIIRRLTSAKDSFFHLAGKDYGEREMLRVNEAYTDADLIILKKRTQVQVSREPEFDTVKVTVTLTKDEILYLNIDAHVRSTGQTIQAQIPVEMP